MKALTAVILAAGDSKRMRSKLPKTLHRVSDRPLVDYPVRLSRALGEGAILVLPGDQPLMSQDMIQALVEHHGKTGAAATLLTAELPDATGYGRVIREGGRPVGIVEHRDATPAQRAIHEIGTSVYCFDARSLWSALGQIAPQNEQGEYY